MTTRVLIYEFYKVKFGDLWVEVGKNTKFQHNISKIMQARPKIYRIMGVNITILLTVLPLSLFDT